MPYPALDAEVTGATRHDERGYHSHAHPELRACSTDGGLWCGYSMHVLSGSGARWSHTSAGGQVTGIRRTQ